MDSQSSVLNDSEKTVRYKLDNGMTVILEENDSSPVVAVNVWVGTGSACEIDGEFGLAHVHEHMLFKGTKKRKVGEIARLVEAGGGDINAYTSFDETVYFVVSASRFLNETLDILSDVVENSTFDPGELEKELEVVVEEIRRGEDSPSRVLSQKMFETAFDVHPYKRPIIGTMESVKSFTREGILNFYKKWYSPQNMILVIVGDFDKGSIKKNIEKTFGNIKKRSIPECKLPKEPNQNNLKTFVINKDINEGYLSMGYHITSAKDEDTPVIDVISNILGSGDSSRLFRNVKEEKALVNDIYSYAYTPKHEGLFVVGGTLESKKVKEAYKEIIKEIERLKTEPVSSEELSRAIINIESDSIYSKETMQGQAQKLGFFELKTNDYKYEREYLNRVKNINEDDIIRISKKYFKKENLTAGVLLPTSKNNITESELKELVDNTYNEISMISDIADEKNEDVQRYVLDNGIRLLIKENHSVPLFATRAAFLGGSRYEKESNNGISNFVSEMLTRGTKSRTAEEIAMEIESLAGSLEGFSGRNSIGVTVEGLSKNFIKTFEIFSDVILNPTFLDKEIERAKRRKSFQI
ncbi:MAG: hypothetical protein GTO02_07500 [Candidatus Dadabacteria bacterium]|nr:hypothetical protein [Candidatus Dadabacteria bacterium]NIQ14241.1 hypothetical protein [Candidatus Dadabacteria bacterium]